MTTSQSGLLFPSPAMLTLGNLFRKASNFLGIGSPDFKPPPLDGEIIYCKNNVCVHPPARLSHHGEHFPGYLNIRSQDDEVRAGEWSYTKTCGEMWIVKQGITKKFSAAILFQQVKIGRTTSCQIRGVFQCWQNLAFYSIQNFMTLETTIEV